MHTNIHSSVVHDSPETAQVTIRGGTDRETWHTRTGILLSLDKERKELLTPVMTWTDPEDTRPSEASQSPKDKFCRILLPEVPGGVKFIETERSWWARAWLWNGTECQVCKRKSSGHGWWGWLHNRVNRSRSLTARRTYRILTSKERSGVLSCTTGGIPTVQGKAGRRRKEEAEKEEGCCRDAPGGGGDPGTEGQAGGRADGGAAWGDAPANRCDDKRTQSRRGSQLEALVSR